MKNKRFRENLLYILSASFCGFSFFIADKATVDLYYASLPLFVTVLLVFLILIILILPSIKKQIKKQQIHNQASWVRYLANGILWAPFFAIFLTLIEKSYVYYSVIYRHGYLYFAPHYKNELYSIVFINLVIFGLILIYLRNISNNKCADSLASPKRFAVGSVGTDKDELGFAKSIPGVIKKIKGLEGPVSVVTIDGEYGFGKSSFTRMLVEAMDAQEGILYSYLSLTETNETEDFSRLFANRWMETLNENYPIVNIARISPLLKNILQESGNGVLSNIGNLLLNFDFCLSRTKDKKSQEDLSKDLSIMFGGIEEITEEHWLFVIDEIDRAKLSEIYRTIEVIERFKLTSANGFPVKLVFILCFSVRELGIFFDKYEEDNELAYLLKTFLINDKKSIDLPLFVPPIEYPAKRNYVINLFGKLAKLNNLKSNGLINKKMQVANFEYIRGFIEDEKEIIGPIFSLLLNESPRILKRVENDLHSVYNFLRNKDAYRFSDLLLMSYVKLRFPILVDFFIKTLNNVIGYDNSSPSSSMQSYFRFKEYREKKTDIIGYIEAELELSEKEKEKFEFNKEKIKKIMHLLGARYDDALNYDQPGDLNKYRHAKSLSYPLFMLWYLQSLEDQGSDWRMKYDEIYTRHSAGEKPKLSTPELLNYADFVKESPKNSEILIDILSILSGRVLNGEIEKKFCYTGDTIYKAAIYKIIFIAMYLINSSDSSSITPNKNIELVFHRIKSILKSRNVTIQAKYQILNSFVNNERGSGSEVHYELNKAYNKLNGYFKNELDLIIKGVMKEYLLYLDEDIYKNEENFFYVLFQSWSGDINDSNGIEIIRKMATKNLQNNIDALNLYWAQYSYKEEYDYHLDDFPEYISHEFDFIVKSDHPELYLPLSTLCDITNKSEIPENLKRKYVFWSTIIKRYPKWYNETFKLKPEITLMSVMINIGLVDRSVSEIIVNKK